MSLMLKQFSVEGYKSFDEKIVLDFANIRDYAFNKECLSDGVITKAGIYGDNGSGKSNLGYALFDIVLLLTDKHYERRIINHNTFLNADSDTSAAEFEYVFKEKNDILVFSYSKSNPVTLVHESFSINDKIVYDYDYTTRKFSVFNKDIIGISNLNFEYLENNLSIFRYIANNTVQKDGSPIRSIIDFVSHMLWFRSLHENAYIGFETGITSIDEWIISNDLIEDFNLFLRNVCGIRTKLKASIQTGADGSQSKVLVEQHDKRNLVFNEVYSSGTQAAILFYYWSRKFQDVSFLFLDEFDAYYHHTLALNIILELKKYPSMQVIFTTHNLSFIGNDILRPDCYLILSEGKLASFVDSTDREIREGHNLSKLYRNGEFG